jgi:molybdate/tungstate transport system substrate-binding protein
MSIRDLTRRELLRRTSSLAAAAAIPRHLFAQSLPALDVASAGSFRAMLDGPLKTAAAQTLQLDLRSHSQGADTVAHSLIDGTLHADLFIPITASPLQTVIQAGKAETATPIARTELVLLYSPKSRFAAQFELAAQGKADWWKILQQPGLRIARSNPAADPSGRAIIFALMLAAKKYNQPNLVANVLGPIVNPAQILTTGNNQALLQSGELDAMCVYKTGPSETGQPYITLPSDINLSRQNVRSEHPGLSFTIDGKTFYPEPLVFYAAILTNAANPKGAAAFLAWLTSEEAQHILQSHHFEAPGNAAPLHA